MNKIHVINNPNAVYPSYIEGLSKQKLRYMLKALGFESIEGLDEKTGLFGVITDSNKFRIVAFSKPKIYTERDHYILENNVFKPIRVYRFCDLKCDFDLYSTYNDDDYILVLEEYTEPRYIKEIWV